MTPQTTRQQILEIFITAMAEVTGVEGEISPDNHLEEDLSVDMQYEFPRIIARVGRKFGVQLNSKHLIDELITNDEDLTVEALIGLIQEEVEL